MTATRAKERPESLDLDRYGRNIDWAEANYEKLKKHVNRFVAIDGGRVIGVADDEYELYQRFVHREHAYITWVEPEGLVWV